MFIYLSSGYLESLHMPEYEKSFSYCVSGLGLVFLYAFLQDSDLGIELINLVLEEEDFLVFLINGHGSQAFEATFSNSA